MNYDQIIMEIGPPDKSAKLTDGTQVAEWLTARGYRGSMIRTSFGHGFYGHHHVEHYFDYPESLYYIRLTFAPDGVLNDWKKVVK